MIPGWLWAAWYRRPILTSWLRRHDAVDRAFAAGILHERERVVADLEAYIDAGPPRWNSARTERSGSNSVGLGNSCSGDRKRGAGRMNSTDQWRRPNLSVVRNERAPECPDGSTTSA